MDRKKPLRVPRRFEPAHLVFALARQLMRDFRSIVAATAEFAKWSGAPLSQCFSAILHHG
jgi:hypothetical protein